MVTPECIICNIDLEPAEVLLGKAKGRGKRIQRHRCPICDYSTTIYKGFNFSPFNQYWLNVGNIFKEEERNREIPLVIRRPSAPIFQMDY